MDGPWKYSRGTLHVPVCTSTDPAMSTTAARHHGAICANDIAASADQ